MSGIRSAKLVDEVADLQDILYEIVAAGVIPENCSASLAKIELFLHQHARDPKSRAVFEAFFEGNGISRTAPRFVTMASDHEVRAALPELAPAPEPVRLPVAVPADEDESVTQPRIEFASIPIPAETPGRPIGLWMALLTTLLLLGAAVTVGYREVVSLRGELQQAKASGDTNAEVIQQLEDRAVTLQSTIAANGEVIHSMDQKSSLILDTISRTEPE